MNATYRLTATVAVLGLLLGAFARSVTDVGGPRYGHRTALDVQVEGETEEVGRMATHGSVEVAILDAIEALAKVVGDEPGERASSMLARLREGGESAC